MPKTVNQIINFPANHRIPVRSTVVLASLVGILGAGAGGVALAGFFLPGSVIGVMGSVYGGAGALAGSFVIETVSGAIFLLSCKKKSKQKEPIEDLSEQPPKVEETIDEEKAPKGLGKQEAEPKKASEKEVESSSSSESSTSVHLSQKEQPTPQKEQEVETSSSSTELEEEEDPSSSESEDEGSAPEPEKVPQSQLQQSFIVQTDEVREEAPPLPPTTATFEIPSEEQPILPPAILTFSASLPPQPEPPSKIVPPTARPLPQPPSTPSSKQSKPSPAVTFNAVPPSLADRKIELMPPSAVEQNMAQVAAQQAAIENLMAGAPVDESLSSLEDAVRAQEAAFKKIEQAKEERAYPPTTTAIVHPELQGVDDFSAPPTDRAPPVPTEAFNPHAKYIKPRNPLLTTIISEADLPIDLLNAGTGGAILVEEDSLPELNEKEDELPEKVAEEEGFVLVERKKETPASTGSPIHDAVLAKGAAYRGFEDVGSSDMGNSWVVEPETKVKAKKKDKPLPTPPKKKYSLSRLDRAGTDKLTGGIETMKGRLRRVDENEKNLRAQEVNEKTGAKGEWSDKIDEKRKEREDFEKKKNPSVDPSTGQPSITSSVQESGAWGTDMDLGQSITDNAVVTDKEEKSMENATAKYQAKMYGA